MTKLIVFDKDGTLTEPISGQTFVRHPQDQKLRPGVAEKLQQLREECWLMAIASNQGGCAEFEVLAESIKPGMQVQIDGYWAKVQEVEATSRNTHLLTTVGRFTVSGLYNARYKSIGEAAEEMRFAMGLTGISRGTFCPDAANSIGENVVLMELLAERWLENKFTIEDMQDARYPVAVNGFRKPQNGMLCVLAETTPKMQIPRKYDRLVMVGDRPEDQQAAQAANFEFYWADEFFGGANG